MDAKRHELAELDELLGRADDVRTAVSELEQLRAADASARTSQEHAAELTRRAAAIAAAIDGEARTITERLAERRTRIAELERELGPLRDARTQLTATEHELDAMADPETGLAEAREHLELHQTAGARCDEQSRAAEERISVAEDALAVLKAGGGECPVCGHVLDAEHRKQAKQRLTDDLRAAKADQQTAKAGVATARKEAKRLAEEIRRLDAVRVTRERLVAARLELLARLERVDPVAAALDELRTSVAADEEALADGAFAAQARLERAALEERAAATYDAAAHRELLTRIAELEPAATLLGSIEEAARRRGRVVADAEAAAGRAAQLEAEQQAHVRTIDELERSTAGAGEVAEHVRTCHARLESVQRAAREVAAGRARAEERLEAARRIADELEDARATERTLATETRRYRRLTEAFGRGGIPDRIIDNALPNLTDDANRILGRLSDHEMSVRFQLQRDTRSGKPKETFEALVHHDGGVRDFAMFSGGEAFRVAFAVRLAMSKLLVARAGARLETLVIDEGFGTQDPQGRERLVEAIKVARTEFAKILVITHLEDLKDQFGAQIVVTKGPEGSLVQLTGV
jgi:exonuclease SbcC